VSTIDIRQTPASDVLPFCRIDSIINVSPE
jgi:hypothetical protein